MSVPYRVPRTNEFTASEQDRELVKILSAAGVKLQVIADCISWSGGVRRGVSIATLKYHFMQELETGMAHAVAKGMQKIIQNMDSRIPAVSEHAAEYVVEKFGSRIQEKIGTDPSDRPTIRIIVEGLDTETIGNNQEANEERTIQ